MIIKYVYVWISLNIIINIILVILQIKFKHLTYIIIINEWMVIRKSNYVKVFKLKFLIL